MRFRDSSAIFPLVADDEHAALAAAVYDDDARMAVWCLTPVEVWSALARRRREGLARSPDMHRVLTEAAELLHGVDAGSVGRRSGDRTGRRLRRRHDRPRRRRVRVYDDRPAHSHRRVQS